MKSKYGKINVRDLLVGALMASLMAVLTGLYQIITENGIDLDLLDLNIMR